MRLPLRPLLPVALLLGCSSGTPQAGPTPRASPDTAAASIATDATATSAPQPILAPRDAFARGWMPLSITGVTEFRKAHPTYDGRGVIIGILDSGIDPGIPGLSTTSTGDRKILDLRDFSGEGAVKLEKLQPSGDSVTVAGVRLGGFGRVRARSVAGTWYGGSVRELSLGEMPAADLNGNHLDTDTLPLLVTRASDGWVLFADTDGDGSLADERPVHDYLTGRETFGWAPTGNRPPATIAVNLRDVQGAPELDLFFDTSAHGSHVAGIASAHDMYGVAGFDGVAPGAQIIGLKIANNAEAGISTTGSMIRAIDYAINFAARRRVPLVLNMSFGVGNEREGAARIDQMIDSVLTRHPDVVFTISAGNDGPGLSTMGFPGSATRALTIGAVYPLVFAGPAPAGRIDPIADFSSRGGELAKPDLAAPGLAYSTVPKWNTGSEQKGGTSMASPHAAGLAALLISAVVQGGGPVDGRMIRQALMVTARPIPGETYLDDGTGIPDVNAAYRWLQGKHQVPEVWAKPADNGVTAAFRRDGLTSPGDTLQTFLLTRPAGATAQSFVLRSNAGWLMAPQNLELAQPSGSVTLSYVADSLRAPGVYTGVVSGWSSDTLAGPAFRLVNTVIVPARGSRIEINPAEIQPGSQRRLFFEARAGRPFFVATATTSRAQQATAYLHEPGGQPFRDDNGLNAGAGDEAAVYQVDGRDVVTGLYEAVTVAPQLQRTTALTVVGQSPVVISAARDAQGVAVTLQNLDSSAVSSEPFVVLVGAERDAPINARGSGPQSVPFTIPAWAVHATIDVTMDPAQWPRFTDLGLILFDSVGRQLGNSPLNYALGRLHVDLAGRGTFPATVKLFPGFAVPDSNQSWIATVSIRLYADSAKVVRLDGGKVVVPPGGTATARVPFQPMNVELGEGFSPLGIVVAPVGDLAWTREAALPLEIPLSP